MRTLFYLLLLFIGTTLFGQNGEDEYNFTDGTFNDPRDGKTYKTITFRYEKDEDVFVERTWFAENLNYEIPNSYCYNDEPAYCEKYGRLYNYKSAKASCPDGWHLPTIDEWNHLFANFGGIHKAGAVLIEGGGSNMHMLYGGFGEPGHVFIDITRSGNWWDSELKGDESAGIITLESGTSEIFHEIIGNYHRLSSRCVKFHSD